MKKAENKNQILLFGTVAQKKGKIEKDRIDVLRRIDQKLKLVIDMAKGKIKPYLFDQNDPK